MKKSTAFLFLLLLITCFSGSVFADNPIITHKFSADPNALVHNGRVYVYCSNDDNNKENYGIIDYTIISSDDLVNWTDHGLAFRVPRDASWASRAFAPSCVKRSGKFFLYFPDGGNSIGVAVGDRPEGPFKDALGKPLINKKMPNCNVQWCFDPAAFIDDDGQAYLYFGGGMEGIGENLRVIKLNDDMISVSDTARTIKAPASFEAAFMHKYNDTYYFSYATNGASKIDYLMSTSPLGPFTHKGTVLPNPVLDGKNINRHNNNHSSIVQFHGTWYMFYHDRRISNKVYKRNVCVDMLEYNSNGTIKPVVITRKSVPQLKRVDPFDTVQCETIDRQSGIETETCSEGGIMLSHISEGDYTSVSGVDFKKGASRFSVRAASKGDGGTIELHVDGKKGAVVGTCTVSGTGGWKKWKTFSCAVSDCSGVKNLYLVYKGAGEPFRLDWFCFHPLSSKTTTGKKKS